jgi:hypothetical protein
MALTPEEEEFARLDPNTLDPHVAKVIFATEWDDAIDFFRAVATAAGMTHEDFQQILNDDKAFLEKHVRLPRPMTMEKSKPFVELSDMLTLARLARFCFERVDNLPLDLG